MDLNRLDLNLLKVFDAVMAARHVGRAASSLGLTQPAVSNALARLRQALGDDLFLRTPRGMEPTALARDLAQAVRGALGQVEEALGMARPFDPARASDAFVVGASDHAETALVPLLAGHLSREAPGVSLATRHADKHDAVALIEAGTVDLALGVLPEPPAHMVRVVVARDRLVTVLRKGHPAARGRLGLEAFLGLGHVLVSPTGERTGAIDAALAKRGLSRRVAVVLSHYGALAALVRDSDLAATLPERVARTFVAAQGLVLVPPPIDPGPVRMHAVWHRRDERRPAHVWLRRTLLDLARTRA
jgi:LysR family transcriptional activator of mexEF-oprN operon